MFDPNKEHDFNWATYIPDRSPKFKVHQNKGLATAALKYRAHDNVIPEECLLYEKREDKWVEMDFGRSYLDGERLTINGPVSVSDKPEKEYNGIRAEKTGQIVFSFDTTGSMRPCIDQVRDKLRDLAVDMTKDMPDLKIGIIAHGDYGDRIPLSMLEPTNDINKVIDFIKSAPDTSGGDYPEFYEYVLQQINKLDLHKGDTVVIIGDAFPHGQSKNRGIDWKKEVNELIGKGVKLFSWQCQANHMSDWFWSEMAEIAKTPLIKLENFQESADTLEALAYSMSSEEVYTRKMMKNAEEEKLGLRPKASKTLVETRSKIGKFIS